ncbi:MAG TPA: hypothetical protein VF262_05290 [Burkholderiales bacterium]|jgi:hypothetical protein
MSDVIELIFADAAGKTVRKGPFRKFCLQGETLREELNGPPIAVHEGHHWQIGGKQFARFDCDCSIRVHLTRVDGKRTHDYGPYKSLSAQDGVLFADHAIFAFADRSLGDWYCHSDGLHWALVFIESAG